MVPSFIRNLSTLLHPLNSLLQKGTKWKWSADCQKAFDSAKKSLTSLSVLVHYDPSLLIRVAADASSHGLGAVLSHVLPDGTEHPIAFASRTLSSSEKKLRTRTKGGTETHVCSKKVPSISLWPNVFSNHR